MRLCRTPCPHPISAISLAAVISPPANCCSTSNRLRIQKWSIAAISNQRSAMLTSAVADRYSIFRGAMLSFSRLAILITFGPPITSEIPPTYDLFPPRRSVRSSRNSLASARRRHTEWKQRLQLTIIRGKGCPGALSPSGRERRESVVPSTTCQCSAIAFDRSQYPLRCTQARTHYPVWFSQTDTHRARLSSAPETIPHTNHSPQPTPISTRSHTPTEIH